MRSAPPDRRVVITGLGAITPLGDRATAFFTRLAAGATGMGPPTHWDAATGPLPAAAEVRDFDPAAYGLSPRELRILAPGPQFALAAAEMAVQDAGLDLPRQDVRGGARAGTRWDRYGVAIGAAFPGTDLLATQLTQLAARGPRGVSPHLFNMTLPNAATSVVSIRYALGGPLVTVSGATAAGAESVIAAYDKIRSGRADLMLAGGAEAGVTAIIAAGFAQNRTGARSGHCRPFDRRRDGTLLGEGAAVFVLEDRAHALARGARSYGEILGYGQRADGYDLTDIPEATAPGLTACLREALADAGLAPAAVQYVNAHGTGTAMNDRAELQALRQVFGPHAASLYVSSIKGSVGHALGAAGAIELLATLLASCYNRVPPTYGLVDPEEPRVVRHVMGQAVAAAVDVAVSISVGMGGGNAAIVVRGAKLPRPAGLP
ncbi:MAG TPA: beta-ketoacyl-[acyl-carrier-protein] synthase family protein [Chloroflexia bacterium]|nr:beta-ketoacyl-[acyl-carrier-protein] synthase family protein [Chloroflexia bacterium]